MKVICGKDNTINQKATTKNKKTELELVSNRGAIVESWKVLSPKEQIENKYQGDGFQPSHSDGRIKSEWSVRFHSVSEHWRCFHSSYAFVLCPWF